MVEVYARRVMNTDINVDVHGCIMSSYKPMGMNPTKTVSVIGVPLSPNVLGSMYVAKSTCCVGTLESRFCLM